MCALCLPTVPIVPNVLLTFKAKSVVKSIFERSTCNCTWDADLANPLMDAIMHLTPSATPSTAAQVALSEIDFIDPKVASRQERREVARLLQNLKTLAENCNINTTAMAKEVRESRVDRENFAVGMLFASKPIVQLIVNPMVGPLINMCSVAAFAFGESYQALLLARIIQGVGSACSTVSGMGMLATYYKDPKERSQAFGHALTALALGVLVGPTYGGIVYEFVNRRAPYLILAALAVLCGRALTFGTVGIAVLEPTLPMWMKEHMKSNSWEQGIVFLPSSISYLLSTNIISRLAHKVGHWLSALLGMLICGLSLICVPFAQSMVHLLVPVFTLGVGIGMVDASMMPQMGCLVDLRHVAVYGSVYAIADAAFCLGFAIGPVVSGSLAQTVGFSWSIWGIASVSTAYAPLLFFLRNPRKREETRDASSFVFTLTEKDRNRVRYGICLNFVIRTSSPKNSSDVNELEGGTDHLISFCIISHHTMFASFRKCLTTLKEMIDCIPGFGILISGKKWDISSFWDMFLFGHTPNGDVSKAELQIATEIEKWILRLTSAPAPVPGYTYIQLSLLPEQVENPLIFALPDKSRLALLDFPFNLPFELLGVEKCLQVILAIILEQKVLVKSRDYNALTMSVLALVAMLYPLQYMFPVIPLLPTSLPGAEQILLSPTPFLIGIPSSFLQDKAKNISLEDVWIADLDSAEITAGKSAARLPPFPEPEVKQLIANLEKAHNSAKNAVSAVSSRSGDKEGPVLNSPDGYILTSSEDVPFDADAVDVLTRVAMVEFFNSPSLLADFTEHTRTLRLFPNPIVNFQYISFIRSRPSLSQFTQRLAKTQAVEYLAEWCLYPENEVFQRIHAGIVDPVLIGDKPKWFRDSLVKIDFSAFEKTDVCVIHLGCCKNRNEWGLEHVSLDQLISAVQERVPLRSASLPEDPSPVDRLLVNYKLFYSTPTSVEQTVAFASAVREREASSAHPRSHRGAAAAPNAANDDSVGERSGPDGRQGSRTFSTSTLPKRASTIGDSDEAYDDVLSTSGSANEDSDLDDSDIWDLKNTTFAPVNNDVPHSNATNDLEPGQTTSARLTARAPKLSEIRRTGKPPTKSVSENEQVLHSSFPWQSKDQDKSIRSNGALNSTRRQSTASNSENADDMEDVTIGMHIISNLSDAFTGAVSRASSAFSGILSEQKEDVPGKRRTSGTRLKKLLKPSKFFGLEEDKSDNLTKHPSLTYQLSYEDISTQKQELLINLTRTIWTGEKVSLSVKNDVRALMEDERYRSYVLVKLLAETHDYAYDAEDRVPDVALQDTNMFRNLVWIVRTIISGYERNWVNRGVNSVGSAFMLLELAHTHFWDQKSALEQLISTSDRQSQKPSSLRGSTENLAKPDKGSLANFAGWIKSTAKEIRRSSLVGNSTPETETRGAHPSSAEVSVLSSPQLRHGQPNSGRKLFAREVVFDEPDTLKSRSSSRLRVVNGQFIQCKNPAGATSNSPHDLHRSHPARYYIFETLISSTDRSRIWDQTQFWEDAYLDAVGRERDIIGLDHSATSLLKKYSKLSQAEKKLLELKEDRILACLLHNMIAYMVMLRLPEQQIRTVTYRLLGRCRLGAYFSGIVSQLVDNVHRLEGNSIDLLPVASKSLYKQAFVVFRGNNSKGNDAFVFEIYRRSFLLRNLSGAVDCVKPLTNLLAAILFPKARVLVLLEVTEEKVTMLHFCSRKARTLFYAIKVAAEQNMLVSKKISEPVTFCQRVATNGEEVQAKLEALGPAEGVTFSKQKSLEREI
ncbi:hypothetical protein SprV_0200939600 [Sparganum proliferum]